MAHKYIYLQVQTNLLKGVFLMLVQIEHTNFKVLLFISENICLFLLLLLLLVVEILQFWHQSAWDNT